MAVQERTISERVSKSRILDRTPDSAARCRTRENTDVQNAVETVDEGNGLRENTERGRRGETERRKRPETHVVLYSSSAADKTYLR